MTESKWIIFEEVVIKDRKTKVYTVRTEEGRTFLGEIKWYGAWRCYAFYPTENTVFEKTCLKDITTFLEKLMLDRKLERQKI